MINKTTPGDFLVSHYSRLISFFCLFAPCLVVTGWAIDNKFLKTWDMIGPSMNPLTAIILMLCGTILFLFSTGNFRWITMLSWVTLVVLTVNMLAGFTGYYLDTLLFTEELSEETPINHMAFPTMLCFMIMCIAFTAAANARFRLSQLLSACVFFMGISVFIAYIYGNTPLQTNGLTPMALNTAVSLMLLSSATALLYPNQEYARSLTGEGSGAKLSRRVIPLVFVFVIALGFLRLQFSKGIGSDGAGLALIAGITILAFVFVVTYYSFRINSTEEALRHERNVIIQLNKKLNSKNRELQQKNEELEKFTQSVSHDIRSPLGAIMNVADKLLNDEGSFTEYERKEFLKLIKTTSESVNERTTQMLELAKAVRKPIKKAPVNSSFLVSEVLKELKAESVNKQIDLQMKALPVVMADKALLKSVFFNLINNAVKFNKGKVAKIIVSCHQKGKEKIFAIRDFGIGLDMKSFTNLFKAFSKADSSGNEMGTGLGLSIVKRIVERHGGRVWARPGEKGGAVFYFSLPS